MGMDWSHSTQYRPFYVSDIINPLTRVAGTGGEGNGLASLSEIVNMLLVERYA